MASSSPRGRGGSGFTLLELLAAAMVFSLVGLAMGIFVQFAVSRVEEGAAAADLQRNGALAALALEGALKEAREVRIPAEGEPPGENSITIIFHPEPFEDEDLDGRWDDRGASGPCAPLECFEDINGNGRRDPYTSPPRSFRLSGGVLQSRTGNGPWEDFLEDRYPEAEASSVWVDLLSFRRDSVVPGLLHIRMVFRDDGRTPSDPVDDMTLSFRILVHLGE